MSEKSLEDLLEKVLTKQWFHKRKNIQGAGFGGSTVISDDECSPLCRVCEVKRCLLPLLEALFALKEQTHIIHRKGEWLNCPICLLVRRCDAALQAAKGEK